MTTENKKTTLNLNGIELTDELVAAILEEKRLRDEEKARLAEKKEIEKVRERQEKGVFYSFEDKDGQKVEIKGLRPSTFVAADGMIVLCARIRQDDEKVLWFVDGEGIGKAEKGYIAPTFEPATGIGKPLKIMKSCINVIEPTAKMKQKRSNTRLLNILINEGIPHDEAVKMIQASQVEDEQ